MILRFVVKNLFSFKEETEFNLFPNKTARLPHHKVNVNGIDVLRLGAVYGANGSGKSNFIKSVSLLKKMIKEGTINNQIENNKFKLSPVCKSLPIEIGIEFYYDTRVYYYTISINNNHVVYEYLAESNKEKDILIFERTYENNIQKIQFSEEYNKDEKNKLFASVLEEKILEKDQLLLSFLSKKYENEFVDIKIACDWFVNNLVIISPDMKLSRIFAHYIDAGNDFWAFANNLVSSYNTGISELSIKKKNITEYFNIDNSEVENVLTILQNNPNKPAVYNDPTTGEDTLFVNEDNKIIAKRLFTEHTDDEGNSIEFSLSEESDGTRRLLDYIPALRDLVNTNGVFLIDEMERSIHPLMIKEIISKFSLDKEAKGQLIFTTHESCLLDQDILRPDEIWFCQKDMNGATKLYSLSDFKVHNTINIENNYLSGRYGGIPFLSNLHDLNWHKYSDVK